MRDSSGGHDPASAWRATVLKQRPWLHALVARRLGEPAAVEDVLHDILAAALDQKPNGEPVRDVPAWLRGVALRRILMHRRSRGRARRLEQTAGEQRARNGVAHTPPLPLDALLRTERDGRLADALHALDDEDAELLRMKYIDGLSYNEIAERTGATWNSVAHRLRNARQRLRELLRDD